MEVGRWNFESLNHRNDFMDQQHPFEARLAAAWPKQDWQELSILVAVSGGADSVALLRGLLALRDQGPGTIHVAHMNHGLRGSEATEDQAFVEELCDTWGVPAHVGQTNTRPVAAERGDGIEEAARELRYAFLRATAERVGARYVATAHTADDQVETILYRILRGTGISGLRGIPRVRRLTGMVTIIRPLLNFRRRETLEYLATLEQDFRTDSSNRDVSFMRNRIRLELLPLLASDYYAQVDDAILRLGRLATDAQKVVDDQVDQLWDHAVISQTADQVVINIEGLQGVNSYLIRELLIRIWREQSWPQQSMGWDQWSNLAFMTGSDAASHGPMTLPGGIRVRRSDTALWITK